jgi:hypothetical protein
MEGYPCLLSIGAPNSLVRHRTATVACQVRDFLPNRAQTTVAPQGRLAHRTLSGAHRTVRCAQPTVGSRHVSPTDCAADRWRLRRWLNGHSGAPSDSLVNYSHVAFLHSRERRVRADDSPDSPVHHRTVRCTTGQSGEL